MNASIDIWVLMDAQGDYGVGRDEDDVHNNYTDNVGDMPSGTRLIKVKLSVPLPSVVEMTGDVPEEKAVGAVLQVA